MKTTKLYKRNKGVAVINLYLSITMVLHMMLAMPVTASISEFAARIDPAGLGMTMKMAETVPAVATSVAAPSPRRSSSGGGSAVYLPPLLMGSGLVPRVVTIPGHWETQQVWVPGSEGYKGYWEEQQVWVPEHTEIKWESPKDSDTKEPIDTATGNNYFTEQRLHVPCPGIPLAAHLKYQSVASMPEGRLGKGWHHSYEWTLDAQDANNVAIHTATGGKLVFEPGTNGLYQPPEVGKWELESSTNGYEATMLSFGLVYDFTTNGQLSSIHDAWGNRVECSYGTNDCLEAVTHPNGRQILFSNEWHAVSNEWRVASISVPGGASLEFDYNSDAQLAQVVEQVGANSFTSSYQYADGFLTNKINGAGFEYTYGYEEENNTLNGKGTYLSVDGYYEHELSYADFSTDVTYNRRGTNQIFRYSRNFKGKADTTYGPAESIDDIEQRGKHYVYATNGLDTVEETFFDDATGAAWSKWMLYDDAHNVTNFSVSYCTTNPVRQLSLEYDSVTKLPTAVVDADNLRLEIVYTNGLPLVEKAFHSDSNSYDTCYSYTTNGLLRTVTNANGHASSFGYDAMGNLISASAELGPVATNTYNVLGFLESTEILSGSGASTGRITQYGNDARGRVVRAVFADGLTNNYSYNALGYLTNRVDRAGRVTEYTYAPTEKLTSVTRYLKKGGAPVPVRIGYDLDEQVNVLSITEPRGRYVESYQLDIQDRIASVTNIEGQVMDIDYSIGGFVTQITRFDGSTVTNAYDNAGLKESVTYYPGGANPISVNYSYYPDGLPESVSDGTSTVSNFYDRLNRLTNTVASLSSISSAVNYFHDPVGNVTNAMVDIGSSHVLMVAYEYDAAERLKEISATGGDAEAQDFVYSYSPVNGRIDSVSNTVSGVTCAYEYDIMNRMTNIIYRSGSGSLIRSFDYTYDAASMITNKIVNDGFGSTTNSYRYDSLDRLVYEERSGSVSSAYSVVYSYDLAGNRLTRTEDGLGVAYTLGDGNRLASAGTIGVIDVQGGSSEPIGTDDRWGALWVSNLNAQVGWMPEFDDTDFWVDNLPLVIGTNQIVAAIRDQAGNTDYTTNAVYLSATSTNMQYGYDAAGCVTNLNGVSLDWDERYRLASVSSATSSVFYAYDVLGRRVSRIEGSSTNYFVYDGGQVVADLNENGELLRTYVWGQGIDNLLCFTDHATSNTYYAIKDHQNSVIALVDENGTVVESYEYSAYGETKVFNASGTEISSSAFGNRYCFQGREIDWHTGLYYFRARWFDPETGRWLSKDPIGISGGLNQYAAFENNPINFIDPLGLRNVGQAAGAAADMAGQGNPFSYTSSLSPQANALNNSMNQQGNAEAAYPKGTEVNIDPTKPGTTVPPKNSPTGDIREGRKNENPWDKRYDYTTKNDDEPTKPE